MAAAAEEFLAADDEENPDPAENLVVQRGITIGEAASAERGGFFEYRPKRTLDEPSLTGNSSGKSA